MVIISLIKGQLDICKLLLGYSLDRNPRDNSGSTPLHDAAFKGHLKVCQLLLENIEEKNPVDKKGWTPLYLAAQNGHKDICQLIMEYIDMDNHDKSQTQMSKRNGLLEFVQLFIDSDSHDIYFWKTNYESSRK